MKARRLALVAICLAALPAAEARAGCDQDARLVAADDLRQAKLFGQAQTQAASLLIEPKTSRCAARELTWIANDRASAEKTSLFVQGQTKLSKSLSLAIDWLIVPFMLAVLIGLLLGLVRGISEVRRRSRLPQWYVRSVAKDADPQVVASWRAALSGTKHQGREQLALLVSSGVRLPIAAISWASRNEFANDVLADAPEVYGIKLSWIGALWQAARRIATSQKRTLSVWGTVRGQSAMMRVEAVDANGNLRSTSLSTGWASDEQAAREIETMSAAMALRTHYLIADEPSSADPTARAFLYEGIERLGAYASGGGAPALNQAVTAFGQTRRLAPADPDALLYEGIAHELLEEHDLAQALFRQAEKGANQTTAAFARFNRAISDLRRYTPADLESAISQLETIRSGNFSPELKAFATAAKAAAIAHKFIFWRHFDPTGDRDFSKWQEPALSGKRRQLRGWSKQIKNLLEKAGAALEAAPFNEGVEAATQLRWMIANARGNQELNRATNAALAYGLSESGRKQSLNSAIKAFRECEALLPPGVETLSNIATVLSELERYDDAIRYAEQARALNPSYEYAYYREAQAEQRRGRIEEARAVLETAKRQLPMIKIPEFRALFSDLNVALDGA